MDDTLQWLRELRELIHELDDWWKGNCPPEIEHVPREYPIVHSFVYGYPTFSGKRGHYRVSVTVEYFHCAVTSLLKKGEHLEMLCLTIKHPQDVFVSLLHRQWFDKKIRTMSRDWQVKTYDKAIDREYFIQARSDRGKTMVRSTDFSFTVQRLLPFASMAIDDTGVRLSIPISTGTQLKAASVDSAWSTMSTLIR